MAKTKNVKAKKPSKKAPKKSVPAKGYQTKAGLTHGQRRSGNPLGIALP